MARARNIKPALFTNDTLAENDALGRLLFIGLWTIADFKGDVEWRPKRVKAQVLPYDDCDIEKLAINLDKSGLKRNDSASDRALSLIPYPDSLILNPDTLIAETVAAPPKPKQKRFVEPTIEEVRFYFSDKGETQSEEPQRFHDYYTSNGWKVSNNKMKCWKASARGWISRNKSGGRNATYKQTNQPAIDPNDTSWGDEFITTGSEQGNAQPSERDIQGFEGDTYSMETSSQLGFDRGRH